MHVTFVVEAGPGAGIGHAMRCTTLAVELRGRGHRVDFLAPWLPDVVRRRLADVGAVVEVSDPMTPRRLRSPGPQVAVVDGYGLGALIPRLAGEFDHLVVIDDNFELPVDAASLVVNQNLHAASIPYTGATKGRCLLGPRFALLRTEVVELSSSAGRDRPLVLVAFGGTDPGRNTVPVVQRLAERADLDLVVALAASHPDHRALEAAVSDFGPRIWRAGPDLVDALSAAQFAIVGGGTTMWELAFLGIPAVVGVVADNQVAGAAAAAAAGIARVVEMQHGSAVEAVVEALRELVADPEASQAMARAGRRLFDGRGPARVADAIERLVAPTADC